MENKEFETLVKGMVEQRLNRAGAAPAASQGPRLKVVTESDVRDAGLGGTVLAQEGAIVTAAAEDLARAWGVKIQRGDAPSKVRRRIAVGADHGGYEMKEEVKRLLQSTEGVDLLDLGTNGLQTVDYPDFALAVAEAVASGEAELGIMVDGAGIGSAMTANKVNGIRAAACCDAALARNAREHNFANVLTLGGRMIDLDRMKEIVTAFLTTPTGEERHAARVRKIMAVERKYSR
jgi:ribose 5-phosphate isomerase B